MSTYQDVVKAFSPYAAWALVEASGLDFAPYIGGAHLTGSGIFSYLQTGPFGASQSVGLTVGAKLATPAFLNFSPPVEIETWINVAVMPPTTTVLVWYWGLSGTNGNGVYIDTSGHLHIYSPAATPNDIDTGYVLTAGWHLIQSGNTSSAAVSQLAVDGQTVWQGSSTGGSPGSPNQFFFGGHSGAGTARALNLAFPELSFTPMTSDRARVTYLAASDPNTAYSQLAVGSGDLLSLIYAAVHKTY